MGPPRPRRTPGFPQPVRASRALDPRTPPARESPAAIPPATQTEISIPAAVLQSRPPLRLPEDAVCRSPIAGLVIAVMIPAGQPIKRHQPVLIIEAMKMQNHVSPEIDGVIKTMHVAPGNAVKANQILFELA